MDQGSPKATVFVRDKKNLQQAAEYALLLETLGWGVKGVSVASSGCDQRWECGNPEASFR